MAGKILSAHKTAIESLTLIPSSGGCFELTVAGQEVYSKIKTGQFPDESAMVAAVGKLLR